MVVPLSILLQKTSRPVLIVLSGLLAYQFALLSWSLLPQQEPTLKSFAPKTDNAYAVDQISTKLLQQMHLFGEQLKAEKVVKQIEPVSDAPKTRLNLTLVGVVAATDPAYSSAIISDRKTQASYFIDSKIEGTNASVSEIYQDRVLLNVDGALQTLMLDGVEELEKQQSQDSQEPVSKSRKRAKNQVKTLALDRASLLKNPGKLTDYIRISPVRENGEIKGYSVKPGKDGSLFKEAGLQSGDLAIELNGIDLTDMQQAMSLMKAFPTMTELSLTVERDGQLHELYINIP